MSGPFHTLEWVRIFADSVAIFVTTLVINLMGNGLRDWLDPHMKL